LVCTYAYSSNYIFSCNYILTCNYTFSHAVNYKDSSICNYNFSSAFNYKCSSVCWSVTITLVSQFVMHRITSVRSVFRPYVWRNWRKNCYQVFRYSVYVFCALHTFSQRITPPANLPTKNPIYEHVRTRARVRMPNYLNININAYLYKLALLFRRKKKYHSSIKIGHSSKISAHSSKKTFITQITAVHLCQQTS